MFGLQGSRFRHIEAFMSNRSEEGLPPSDISHTALDPSCHVDTFAREHLPPRDQWPVMHAAGLPGLRYPTRLNAAVELLDAMVERGFGSHPCLHAPNDTWTYEQLLERANRIANLLVSEGMVPGERVLLRDANSPMMAACWFAVLKAGGIAVTTMPQLRARELSVMIEKARPRFALCAGSLREELTKAQEA